MGGKNYINTRCPNVISSVKIMKSFVLIAIVCLFAVAVSAVQRHSSRQNRPGLESRFNRRPNVHPLRRPVFRPQWSEESNESDEDSNSASDEDNNDLVAEALLNDIIDLLAVAEELKIIEAEAVEEAALEEAIVEVEDTIEAAPEGADTEESDAEEADAEEADAEEADPAAVIVVDDVEISEQVEA